VGVGPLPATAGSTTPVPGNHRRTLLIHLAEDLRAAIAAGDIEAARVTQEFIGRLLGSSTTQLAPIGRVLSEATPSQPTSVVDPVAPTLRTEGLVNEGAPPVVVPRGGRTSSRSPDERVRASASAKANRASEVPVTRPGRDDVPGKPDKASIGRRNRGSS